MTTTAPPMRPAKLDLPLIGASYTDMLRTPRHAWWRPLVSIILVAVVAPLVLLVPMGIYGISLALLQGPEAVTGGAEGMLTDAPTIFVLNLSLAALTVVALLAIWVAHPVAPRFLHSVQGRVRWGWLARCVLLLLPLWIVYMLLGWFADGQRVVPRPEDWGWLLLMAFVLTPFQAAGEEYLFRGWVMASVGSIFRHTPVALAVSVLVSSALFAAAHGSTDPWIITDLVVMSIACVYLTWRTGGLEAAVALHVVNNVVVMVVTILNGTIAESFIDADTTGSPLQTGVSALVTVVATALLVWQANKAGIRRTVPSEVGARL